MKTNKRRRAINFLYKLEHRDELNIKKLEYQAINNTRHVQRCREWRENNKAWVKFYDHVRDVYGVNISKDMFGKKPNFNNLIKAFDKSLSLQKKVLGNKNPIRCRKNRGGK